jgi:glycosyltransferase involved in cell wall biosynthesis
VINPKQPEELKNAIGQLLNNSTLRKSLAETSKNSVQAYDWTPIGKKFSTFYNQFI